MLKEIIHFEWRYHTRQISFVAAAILFFLFGFALTATGFGPANIDINSPYSIMQSVGVVSLLSVFVLAIFSSNAMARDREYRMEEIVLSTAVEKGPFLAGRFAGSFLAAVTAFSASLPGMWLALFLPNHDPARIGPLHVAPYLWAMLVMALPNLFFAAVVLFLVATLTRSLLASSVGAVLLYVLYLAASAWTNSPLMASSATAARDSHSLAGLLDPFGLSAFFEQTRYWSALDRNRRLLSLSGVFLANRALWIALGLSGVGLVDRLFSFRLLSEPKSRKPKLPAQTSALPYAPAPTSSNLSAALRAYFSATRLELRSSLTTLPFVTLTLLWGVLAFTQMSADVESGEYGSALYPTAGLLLSAIQQPLYLIALVVLTYYSAEMLWRERTLRMNGVLNATPSPSAVFVLAKWTALCALVAAVTATGTLVALLYQLQHGFTAIDLPVMFAFAWFAAAPLFVLAMAALLIHVLSPHKYFGLLLVLFVGIQLKAGMLPDLHHLWRFGSAPEVLYSEMNGFGPFAAPFNWYMLHWALIGAAGLVISAVLWRRAGALRGSGPWMSRSVKLGLGLLLFGVAASAAHIYVNTDLLNERSTAADSRKWRGDYEKKYRSAALLPQPRITRIEAAVDLFPKERSYRAHGIYELRNEHRQPLTKILLSTNRQARRVVVSMPGASLENVDPRFGLSWLVLDRPLQSGQTATLKFDVTFSSDRFKDTEPDSSIAADGSLLMSSQLFPSFGYRRGYELSDPRQRQLEGLKLEPSAVSAGSDISEEDGETSWIDLDLTLSTSGDQTAVTSGSMVGDWREKGRHFSHYQSDRQIPNVFSIASARYSVARTSVGAVQVALYYHAAHGFNVERMLRAASDTLRYCEQNFGPYPHHQLKIVEAASPGNRVSGLARPDTIFIGETRGFLIDARDPDRLDLVYRRVAHEVAHQWWGFQLSPSSGEGASLLVESLTKYTELMVLERAYGREAGRRSLDFELDLYLTGRSNANDPEVPLARVGEESYLYYRKGALVFNALRDLLGEAKLNGVLATFLREQAGDGHQPTSAQLINHLEAVADSMQRQRIEEWMNQIVLYDLQLRSAGVTPLRDGRFEVRMEIFAGKSRSMSPTASQKISMNEELEVALFADDPDRDASAQNLIALQKLSFHDGINSISLVVPRAPSVAAIDPYLRRIDQNRGDNWRDVGH